MLRGIERRRLFVDGCDRGDMLLRLAKLIPALGFQCFAWAFMPNHVHLVVRSGPVHLSRLLARLGTGYAVRFNSRHGRVGHLFQNRFRSRVVVDDADLHGLVLYVSRNPLDAGLVRDVAALEQYPWCGLGALMGHRVPHPFEAHDAALKLFGAQTEPAREQLRALLGDPEAASARSDPFDDEAPPATPAPSGRGFEELVDEVCSAVNVSPAQLGSRSRTPRLAAVRSAVVTRAARELGLSGAEIARRLGISRAAVSRMLLARRDSSSAL
jgi:REP element-mobilizing transposase RayT